MFSIVFGVLSATGYILAGNKMHGKGKMIAYIVAVLAVLLAVNGVTKVFY